MSASDHSKFTQLHSSGSLLNPAECVPLPLSVPHSCVLITDFSNFLDKTVPDTPSPLSPSKDRRRARQARSSRGTHPSWPTSSDLTPRSRNLARFREGGGGINIV